MSQSKLSSVAEVVVTTCVSYSLSIIIGQYIYPMYGYDITIMDNLQLTAVFVVSSLFIKYGFRRWFNRR